MQMQVSNQTGQPHVARLPAVGIIEVEAIIEVAAIIKVAATGWMTISLDTVPSGATPIWDANEIILDEGPIPGILLTLIHPGSIPTSLVLHSDPAEGADLILTAGQSPDRDLMEDMVIAPGVITVWDPQTASGVTL